MTPAHARKRALDGLEWAQSLGIVSDWDEVTDPTWPNGTYYRIRFSSGEPWSMTHNQLNAFLKGARRSRAVTLSAMNAEAAP